MTAAVFLDRDNTIIHNDGDLGDPSQVRLMQGAASAIASLKGLGYRIIVVTNQGGVARGKYTEADVDRVNERINDMMKANSGVFVDRFYYCPYHPEGTVDRYRRDHPWRKPRPGMLLQAARDLGLELRQSWMIGDQMRDVQAGYSAGVIPILLSVDGAAPPPTVAPPPPGAGGDDRPGSGSSGASKTVLIEPARDFFVVRSLIEAVRLVGQKSRPSNVTAAMKTERIEVIPRPQPRVATASFDASNVPVVGQVPAALPEAAPIAESPAPAAASDVVKSVAFADLAERPAVIEVAKESRAEPPMPTRRRRTEKPRTAEEGGEAKEAGREAVGQVNIPGAVQVTETQAKSGPKPEPRAESKPESRPRVLVEEPAAGTATALPSAERATPREPVREPLPMIEPPRADAGRMPVAVSLPAAERPARAAPPRRREEEHADVTAKATPTPIETDPAPRHTRAPDMAAESSPTIAAPPPASPSRPAKAAAGSSAEPAAAPGPLLPEQTLRQILQELRSQRKVAGEFHYVTIMAIVLQMVAAVCLMGGLLMGAGNNDIFMRWIACAIIVQLATLATLMFRK